MVTDFPLPSKALTEGKLKSNLTHIIKAFFFFSGGLFPNLRTIKMLQGLYGMVFKKDPLVNFIKTLSIIIFTIKTS